MHPHAGATRAFILLLVLVLVCAVCIAALPAATVARAGGSGHTCIHDTMRKPTPRVAVQAYDHHAHDTAVPEAERRRRASTTAWESIRIKVGGSVPVTCMLDRVSRVCACGSVGNTLRAQPVFSARMRLHRGVPMCLHLCACACVAGGARAARLPARAACLPQLQLLHV